MKKTLFCLFILLGSFVSHAQMRERIVQQQVPAFQHFIYLIARDSAGHKMSHLLKTIYNGKEHVTALNLLVASDSFCHHWALDKVYMHFYDTSTGFVYGNTIGYGYCPFLYKTADGGKSWQRIIVDEKHRYSVKHFQNALHMFNEKQGILLHSVMQKKLIYYLTSDGGKTWKHKQTPINVEPRQQMNLELIPIYSHDGTVIVSARKNGSTIALDGQVIPTSHIITTLNSNDFGKSFRKLK